MGMKAWKMSASIVVAVKSNMAQRCLTKLSDSIGCSPLDRDYIDKCNVQILSLRRGEHAKLLPGTHVFPGGNVDESDTNPQWFDFFKASGFEFSSFSSISISDVCGLSEERGSNSLPGWMSLRLCAIRETFEESGILLCRSSSQLHDGSPWTSFVSTYDLDMWQKRVREDPCQMMALCETVRCVPDVWGLHLWSNWLTPVQQRVRNNAFFFLAVLPTMPQCSLDNLEMDELKWCTAVELIKGLKAGQLRLPNPQLYEASRLSVFNNADALATFAAERALHGCECVMPVQEKAKDGLLFLLPGDTRYVENVDYESPRKMSVQEKSLSELREDVLSSDGSIHRIEVPSGNACPRIFVHKYVPTFHHVLPVATDQLLDGIFEPKL